MGLLILPQRQAFTGLRMLVFAEALKLFAGHRLGRVEAQSLPAKADPLAGAHFLGRVIIIPSQMLLEVAFGIGQILLCDYCEHLRST